MLEFNDYKAMLEDGVPRRIVALVERAYSCLFEAQSSLTPISQPWVAMADDLGIDLSDCMDGEKLNKKQVYQKFNSNPTYQGIVKFVDEVIAIGKSKSGVSEYKNVLNSPDFNTFMNNYRVQLIANCVRSAKNAKYDWWSDNGFTAFIGKKVADRIDLMLSGSTSANGFGLDTKQQFDSKIKYTGQFDDMGEKPIYTSNAGYKWYRERIDERTEYIHCKEPSGLNLAVVTLRLDNGTLDTITFGNNIGPAAFHALGDFLGAYHVDLNGHTSVILGSRDSTMGTLSSFLSSVNAKQMVQMCRTNKELYTSFIKTLSGSRAYRDRQITGVVKVVLFLTTAYDTGLATADDLMEMTEPGFIIYDFDPQLQLLLNKLFNLHPNDLLDTLREIPKRYTKNIIASITGASHDDVPDISNNPSTRDCLEPDYQIRNALNLNNLEELVTRLVNLSMDYHRYMPLCNGMLRYIFRSSSLDTEKIGQVIRYFVSCIDGVPLSGNKELFNVIRKCVTPKIQTICMEHPWYSYDREPESAFHLFEIHVPGFRACDKLRDANSEIAPVTPKGCLRDLTKAAFMDNPYHDRYLCSKILYGLASDTVLNDIHTKQNGKISSYTGQRIMTLARQMFVDNPKLVLFAHEFIFAKQLPDLLTNYILPNIEQLANVVDSLNMLDLITLARGAIKLYITDTQLGEAAYMSETGLLSNISANPSKEINFAIALDKIFLDEQYKTTLTGDFCNAWTRFVNRFVCNRGLFTKIVNADGMNAGTQATCLNDLIDLSSIYERMQMASAEEDHVTFSNDNQSIIEDYEFAVLLQDKPTLALMLMPMLSGKTEWITKICEKYFNDKYLTSLCRTKEGIVLFLQMSKWSNWKGFNSNFIRTHASLIKKTVNEVASDNPSLAEHWNELLASINVDTSKYSAQRSSVMSSASGRTVDCSLVNGVNWSRSVLNVPNKGIPGANGSTLYDISEAQKIVNVVKEDGWRLPTVDELDILSGDESTIRENQLGFKNTGIADAATRRTPVAATAFYGWATDEEGNLMVYSVSGNVIDTLPDIDDPADVMAAIKLVHD